MMSVPLAPGVQIFASLDARVRSADDLDDHVEVVESDFVTFEDVFALAGLAQQVGSTALHHVDAVIDEGANCCVEWEPPWAGRSARPGKSWRSSPALGVLVELVEHDLWLRAALELDDDTHAVAIALVANVADFVDDLFVISSAMRSMSWTC